MEILQQTGTGLICYWRVALFWEALGLRQSCKKCWTWGYNRCASLIYKIHTLVILQHSLRSHKIFWDHTRSSVISQDLLWSHNIYWDLTRSSETSRDLLRSHKIYRYLIRSADLTFDIWHLKTFMKYLQKKKPFCKALEEEDSLDFWPFSHSGHRLALFGGAEPYIERATQMNM